MSSEQADMTSLGMFIIDEIHFPHKEIVDNIMGGAGTYAVVGGRMFSKKIGWIVDRGYDFPQSVTDTIDSWDIYTIWRSTPLRKTTRGWNMYGQNEERAFKYLTPKKRIEAADIAALPQDTPLRAKSFHAICSPERLLEIVETFDKAGIQHRCIVWEPVPDSCTPGNYETCLDILEQGTVAVFSPNAKEAAMFIGKSEPETKQGIEELAVHFKQLSNPNVAIVIRAGARGSVVCLSSDSSPKWYPAYHNSGDSDKVVDPTGAGNSFLGAFAVALSQTGDPHHAAMCGSVASGAVVEQIGPPVLDTLSSTGEETWNGVPTEERMTRYKTRYFGKN